MEGEGGEGAWSVLEGPLGEAEGPHAGVAEVAAAVQSDLEEVLAAVGDGYDPRVRDALAVAQRQMAQPGAPCGDQAQALRQRGRAPGGSCERHGSTLSSYWHLLNG